MSTSRKTEIAWAAGLFEGEGSLYLNKQKGGKYTYPRMSLRMNDTDVVDRFAEVVGVGIVKDYPPYQANRKSTRNWTLNTVEEIKTVVAMFWPYLGERRRAKAQEVGVV